MNNEQAFATIELEKKLLSALLLSDGQELAAISAILDAKEFYRPEHRLIYQALLKLHDENSSPNILLLEDTLRKNQSSKQVSREYLYSLGDLEYSASRAEQYAAMVKERSMLRQLEELGRELIDKANSDSESPEKILEFAEQKILAINTAQSKTGFEDLQAIVKRASERITKKMRDPGKATGLPSRLLDLDKALNGFQNSDLIILAARPSMGKTALALNIAARVANNGYFVGIFSLEMSKLQLGNRLLSTHSQINSQALFSGKVSIEDIESILNAVQEMNEWKMFIDDTGGLSLLELRSKARRLKLEHGLDLLIIDYLQLMQGSRTENRTQEISEISRGLKALARELDIPILALSQLSRAVELRAEKKPQLSDLRESGSLEQDADVVMFLYREEYYDKATDNENLAELIIAKNRNGPTTSVNLRFDKDILRFDDLTRADF